LSDTYIVLKGNPLEDSSILFDKANILQVYKGGKLVPRLNLTGGNDER